MDILGNLTAREKEMLLKAPAYVSLLASNTDGEMDEMEKADAIKLAHIKTYSSTPLLRNFYKEAEKTFTENIEELNSSLPKEKHERNEVIKNKLEELGEILPKLGADHASLMYNSLKSYAEHVAKAHRTPIISFVIPFYIKGLND